MTNFKLKVQQFGQICVFELSWGTGQQLSATLNYPESLTTFYQEWQRVYLSYYKSGLRGWIEDSGSLTSPPIDWHTKLVQAEAKFLSEFHHWLRSAELFEIRAAIAKHQNLEFIQPSRIKGDKHYQPINVFLTCSSIELERLPWEAWEIGAEFSKVGTIRIARTPLNIHHSTNSKPQHRSRKARILAILGDDTGLNFKGDKEAVRSLSRIADIEFVGWQPGQNIAELKASISAAIADECGWDILFFAGHSNEMAMTGGELAIAPNISMSIREITPQLLLAKQRGLQFALFNSCSGLNIAASLIDLGLSQVAIMREPIHNDVAQEFLLRFLQGLADYRDVHDCLLLACQHLKLEKNLTYPSTYLIPSLFCHPKAVLFQIKPFGFKEQLKQISPTRTEAIAISVLTALSLLLPVQDFLLEKRLLIQAAYRQFTQQSPTTVPPPVLLVQIDEKSIQAAKIVDPKPMDRKYLASLVDKLSAINAKVVGIDYLLDRPHHKNDAILAKSLQKSILRQPDSTWFVFASVRDYTGGWLTVLPEIASPNWSLQGSINLSRGYMGLVSPEKSAKLPFSYLLALGYQLNGMAFDPPQPPLKRGEQDKLKVNTPRLREAGGEEIRAYPNSIELEFSLLPQFSSKIEFLSQIDRYLKQDKGQDYRHLFSSRAQLQPITSFSYDLGQMWLHPIIDFSIPPQQVYQSIPAWKLLESSANSPQLNHIQQQVVMIAPGGYGEAGIFEEGQDNFPVPAAINYWFKQANPPVKHRRFTGGKTHAYMIHHYLNRRLVVPIPDLWMIGVAVLLGKSIAIMMKPRQQRVQLRTLLGGTVVYGLISLQVYSSGAILLPLVFPSLTILIYFLPLLLRKKTYA